MADGRSRWIVFGGAAVLIAIVVGTLALSLLPRAAPASPPATTSKKTPASHRVPRGAPRSEGGLPTRDVDDGDVAEVALGEDDGDIAEIDDALVEACATFAMSFSLGAPSRAMCSQRTPAGRERARVLCREHIGDEGPMLETMIRDGRVKANMAGLRACAASLPACDERAALVGQVAAGGACDDTIECAPPLTCAAPDPRRQELRCVPLGAAGAACAGAVLPCATGLACVDGTCVAQKRLGPDERCSPTSDLACADGLVCGGARRCKPLAAEGERCEQTAGLFGGARGQGTCAPGLLCLDKLCRAPIESGATCVPGVTACADDCDVCRPVVGGASPLCAPRGAAGDPCAVDDDCVAGLACNKSSGTSACVEAPPLPGRGEACARTPGCAAGDVDACARCADGLHCGRGTCGDGAPGAACDDALDCDDAVCVDGVCVALPSEGACVDDSCAAHHQCVDGVCVPERAFGATCGGEGSARCGGELSCIDGHCLPRRWGGEHCTSDADCRSFTCLRDAGGDDGDGPGVCLAARP